MKYLVAIYHPDNYDGSKEDDAMINEINALNVEMIDAGVRFIVSGLGPLNATKALRPQPNGKILVTDGPYIETKEHMGGFWVLDVADLDEALEWGRKAVIACRAPVEVRPFYGSRAEHTADLQKNRNNEEA